LSRYKPPQPARLLSVAFGGGGLRSVEQQVDHWLRVMGALVPVKLGDHDRALGELLSHDRDVVFPLIAARLTDPEVGIRCSAIEALGWVDCGRATGLLVDQLGSPEYGPGLAACAALSRPAASAAVGPLVAALESAADPQLRVAAAHALGCIGDPAAIPALLKALDTDHEVDILGYTASHSAAMALDRLTDAEEMYVRVGDACKLPETEPDMVRLRRLAEERYRRWCSPDAEPGAAPDRGGM
jgi:hypothetical protein